MESACWTKDRPATAGPARWYISTSGNTVCEIKHSPRLGGARTSAYNAIEMPVTRPAKSQYSEVEAAEELGVSVEQLRVLIRSHVVERDEDLSNVPVTTFQPSDLLILRLLSGMCTTAMSRD